MYSTTTFTHLVLVKWNFEANVVVDVIVVVFMVLAERCQRLAYKEVGVCHRTVHLGLVRLVAVTPPVTSRTVRVVEPWHRARGVTIRHTATLPRLRGIALVEVGQGSTHDFEEAAFKYPLLLIPPTFGELADV